MSVDMHEPDSRAQEQGDVQRLCIIGENRDSSNLVTVSGDTTAGCPAFECSFLALFPDDRPVSNTTCLPEDSDIVDWHWRISRGPRPDYVDKRSLQQNLRETCQDPVDLVLSVGHPLLGYTFALLKGWTHRDISIGNLLRLRKECDRKAFSAMSVVNLLRKSGTQDDTDTNKQALVRQAKVLERALESLEISTKCRAVWTDGDMAANLNGYFDRKQNKSQVSGTKEFMSREMREALGDSESYLHGPLDDLESFFWTMMWATMNHESTRNSTAKKESRWRSDLRSSHPSTRGGVKESYYGARLDQAYSPVVRGMQSFLESWSSKVEALQREAYSTACQLSENSEHGGDHILEAYNSFFFRGVAEYFESVVEHREHLVLGVSSLCTSYVYRT